MQLFLQKVKNSVAKKHGILENLLEFDNLGKKKENLEFRTKISKKPGKP